MNTIACKLFLTAAARKHNKERMLVNWGLGLVSRREAGAWAPGRRPGLQVGAFHPAGSLQVEERGLFSVPQAP